MTAAEFRASVRAYLDRDWGLFERLREAEQAADLEDHRRLAAMLARTAGFPRQARPSPARGRRR